MAISKMAAILSQPQCVNVYVQRKISIVPKSHLHQKYKVDVKNSDNGPFPDIILDMVSANERWLYVVKLSLISLAHTQNDPWGFFTHNSNSIKISFCPTFHRYTNKLVQNFLHSSTGMTLAKFCHNLMTRNWMLIESRSIFYLWLNKF